MRSWWRWPNGAKAAEGPLSGDELEEALTVLRSDLDDLRVWRPATSRDALFGMLDMKSRLYEKRALKDSGLVDGEMHDRYIALDIAMRWALDRLPEAADAPPRQSDVEELLNFANAHQNLSNFVAGVRAGRLTCTGFPRPVSGKWRLDFRIVDVEFELMFNFLLRPPVVTGSPRLPDEIMLALQEWLTSPTKDWPPEVAPAIVEALNDGLIRDPQFRSLSGFSLGSCTLAECALIWNVFICIAFIEEMGWIKTGIASPKPLAGSRKELVENISKFTQIKSSRVGYVIDLLTFGPLDPQPDLALTPIVYLREDRPHFAGHLFSLGNISRNVIQRHLRSPHDPQIGNRWGRFGEQFVSNLFKTLPGVELLRGTPVLLNGKRSGELDLVAWDATDGVGLIIEIKWFPEPEGFSDHERIVKRVRKGVEQLARHKKVLLDPGNNAWPEKVPRWVPEWYWWVIGPSVPQTDAGVEGIKGVSAGLIEYFLFGPIKSTTLKGLIARVNDPIKLAPGTRAQPQLERFTTSSLQIVFHGYTTGFDPGEALAQLAEPLIRASESSAAKVFLATKNDPNPSRYNFLPSSLLDWTEPTRRLSETNDQSATNSPSASRDSNPDESGPDEEPTI